MGRIKALLLSSGTARLACIPLCFLLFAGAAALLTRMLEKTPELTAIEPPVSETGETVTIRGRGFGGQRGSQWVEISGVRLSSSAYESWSENEIRLVIPENYEDGLIRVCTKNRKSNMLVFSRKENIPEAPKNTGPGSLPLIHNLASSSGTIGGVLTIYGVNFGITRGRSGVLFTKSGEDHPFPASGGRHSAPPLILQEDGVSGYEFWSDQEIRVRIPDGAASGPVYVRTERGMSTPADVRITDMPGTKRFENQRVYVLSLDVEITGIHTESGGRIFLRVPCPITTSAQQNVSIRESVPPPYMENHLGSILHQFENLKEDQPVTVHHSVVLTNTDILTDIDVRRVRPYQESSPEYRTYTAADPLVPSDAEEIRAALEEIDGAGDSNPYRRARAVYDWLLENILHRQNSGDPDRRPLDALRIKNGGVYDTAILFCALARAAGIPAVPVAGILIDIRQTAVPHWWAEFYIENFGWVPVDPGMAAGIPYAPVHNETEAADWYFGNIDGNRVAFSRGWTYQNPMTQDSKTVGYPRSFSFQKIWEETNAAVTGYTSFWNTPRVTGVY